MAGNIVGFLKSTISFLDKRVEEIGIITLGLILISSMTFSILARYFVHTTFFSVASHWMEEVAKYSFIWLLYFGASLATRSGGHFKVTAQFSVLPKKARKYASLPGDLIWLIFNLFIIKLGFDLCQTLSGGEFIPATADERGLRHYSYRFYFDSFPINPI